MVYFGFSSATRVYKTIIPRMSMIARTLADKMSMSKAKMEISAAGMLMGFNNVNVT